MGTSTRSILASALALLVACADSHRAGPDWPSAENAGSAATTGAPNDSGGCGSAGAKTGVIQRHVEIFGKSRNYTLVVPSGYDASTSYPLVYGLHGHGGNGARVRSSLDLEAAADGHAIFVYPDGRGGGWDLDSEASKNADVALFDAILALTRTEYCVARHRVFVAGFSNGAYMANQLACRRGDRIRGVATHSGGGPYELAGQYDDHGNLVCNGKPVASLVVNGLADTTVSPSEGQKSIDHWTHANRCSGSHSTAPQGCVEYQGCANRVVACKVPGLGHQLWAQATRLTWSFFDGLR
jgi:polyhydroxybutyrate depolymerase